MESCEIYREVFVQCPKCLLSETVGLNKNGDPVDLSPKILYIRNIEGNGELHCRNCRDKMRVF